MPKPSEIILAVAGLMNDSGQTKYNNVAVLPYLNLSLDELQELFELNDIPVTHETSATIVIPAGVKRLGFDTTPALPSDFIEVRELWESAHGQESWCSMVKMDSLPHYLENNTTISQLLVWSWEHGRIHVIPANAVVDLKIDYTASMFHTPILIKDVNVNLPFTNVKTYLEYKTAALAAMFMAENETRAMALDSLAGTALSRAMGIPIKGQQSIITRRRPFRSSFKQRRTNY